MELKALAKELISSVKEANHIDNDQCKSFIAYLNNVAATTQENEDDIVDCFDILVQISAKPKAKDIEMATTLFKKAIIQEEPIEINSLNYEELFNALDEKEFDQIIEFLILKWILKHSLLPSIILIETFLERWATFSGYLKRPRFLFSFLEMVAPYVGPLLTPYILKALKYNGEDPVNDWAGFSKATYIGHLLQLLHQNNEEITVNQLWPIFTKEKNHEFRETAAQYLSRLPGARQTAEQALHSKVATERFLAVSVITKQKTTEENISLLKRHLELEDKEDVKKYIQQYIADFENPVMLVLPDEQRWLFDRSAEESLAQCLEELTKIKSELKEPIQSVYFCYPSGGYWLMSLELRFNKEQEIVIGLRYPHINFPTHVDDASSDKILRGFRKKYSLSKVLSWGDDYTLPSAFPLLALAHSFSNFGQKLEELSIAYHKDCVFALAKHDYDPEPVEQIYQDMKQAIHTSLNELMLTETIQQELAYICFNDPMLQHIITDK